VWIDEVVQGSGSKILDAAAYDVFHRAFLRPFPPGTPAPRADAYVTMRFVLKNGTAASKGPFTITNEPVHGTVFEKMQDKVCTGEMVQGPLGMNSIVGSRGPAEAYFFRKPDGSAWVRFTAFFGIVFFAPVSDLGMAAQWDALGPPAKSGDRGSIHYALWPSGDNRITGSITGSPTYPVGSIELTCK
jgi:hypothetical protein